MKFFLPYAEDEQHAEQTYDAIKKFAKETLNWDIKDRRIYHIEFVHNLKRYEATVGEIEQYEGEEVIAILESTQTFLVCTKNRGVLRGGPILVGRGEIITVTDFD